MTSSAFSGSLTSGRPRLWPELRIDDQRRVLAVRQYIATTTRRHANLVSRWCEPVACDVTTHQLLYVVDEAEARLAERTRRLDSLRSAG